MVRRLVIVVLLIAGVTLVVMAGTHNLRHRQVVMQKAQQSDVQLTPASAGTDPSEDPAAKLLLGNAAPSFTLVDLNGKKVSLADYKGHAVVLNFWATYCGPCKLEMPWFQDLQNKYKDKGLVVLGLDQDDGMAVKEVAAASKRVGVTYPILMPDDKISKSYQLGDYIPETFYVDKTGKIVEQTIGAHSKDELEADVQKAIASGGM
ncbi:TlpA disulfide reductase family protein [Granulicella sp. L46]|uniref:TlpA family protein disulfide reductase n=1 Tax=Granulicella sp. L46 TaxID=1641865 RepID=UPI0020B1505B|nr:TlpA disulfide reductase family protein [Granulicella sp. L46]